MIKSSGTISTPIEGSNCPKCDGNLFHSRSILSAMFNYTSGIVSCESCDYTIGFMTWLAQNLFPIQSMPLPDALIFYKDDDD